MGLFVLERLVLGELRGVGYCEIDRQIAIKSLSNQIKAWGTQNIYTSEWNTCEGRYTHTPKRR